MKQRCIPQVIDPQRQVSVFPESLPASRFVGTLESDELSSMACLLDDGTVLTTLHSVYDIELSRYYDISDMTVSFVHGGYLYTYAVDGVLFDGVKNLQAGSVPFEFAVLRLKGDPVNDLGGGLKLDDVDHFAGMAGSSEPMSTVAISGPVVSRNDRGHLVATQYVTESVNKSAQSSLYLLNQEADHFTLPGLSGQAVLYPHSETLYGLHIGKEKDQPFGMKISEFKFAIRQKPAPSPAKCAFLKEAIVRQVQHENLRRKGADAKEILSFLDAIEIAVKAQKSIHRNDIPQSLSKDYTDSHQVQHIKGRGYRKRKAYFHQFLGTNQQSPVIIAIANTAHKFASEHYQHHLKTSNPIENIKIRRNSNFLVDLGVEIGIDVEAGNQPTSHVFIDGFGGKAFHVYPIDPVRSQTKNPIIIDARQIAEDSLRNQQMNIK